ncbi:MAG: transcription-repair coupling factor [Phycisphaerales bacterium]|nr:transcription-repair coupling factor [Phycisphaerales bacterium]
MDERFDLIGWVASRESVRAVVAAAESKRRVVATGAVGSSTALAAAALARSLARPVVLVVAHLDDADEALDEINGLGAMALRLPAIEALPGETGTSLDLFAERVSVERAAIGLSGDEQAAPVIIAPIAALMQSVPAPQRLDALSRTLRRGEDVPLAGLIQWLVAAGYERVEAVEEAGDFALRGGILDVFPPGSGGAGMGPGFSESGVPVRLDFFGDTIEKITEIDLETMGSDRAVEAAQLVAADPKLVQGDERGVNFLELLPHRCLAVLAETMEVVEQGRGYYERVIDARGIFGPPAVLKVLETRFHALIEINQFSAGAAAADVRVDLAVSPLPAFARDAGEAVRELAGMADGPGRVLVACQNAGERQRLGELLAEFAPAARERIGAVVAYVHRGFVWNEVTELPSNAVTKSDPAASLRHAVASSLCVVPYHELLNRFTTRRRAARLRSGRAMDTFLDFQVGDYVVHTDHGIALFSGLTMMKPRALPGQHRATLPGEAKAKEPETEEYLTLEFAGRARLQVPVTKIDQVQKYVGGFAGKPPLSTLGGQKWKNQKERTAESVKDLAAEMLRVRAAREHMPGIRYPADTPWQTEFEAEFPYTETEDQLSALGSIKQDMSRERPMDRLICGDVGFGKTELAIRAAFKACEFGKQVAVLVPTTVLAEQHERTFRSRFAGYPFRIESISRFKSDKEAREVLAQLRKGQVDLIIGTHRLLSRDVDFADLGLVVVDEEQRFGVEHKEQLLRLRLTVDVLTLSATPIPRTLHMAMLGIRDISSLTTAPLDRRAIVTEVIPYNARRIQQAIARELSRDGQVFFVHNRIHDIKSVADDIQKLAPEARIVWGHGQMAAHELEEVMLKFMRGQADILVSTTIIESGIDIPTANTMIINDADRFGLAELHQLRGRVGRSKHRAYCYLLLPEERTVKEVAQKRLKAIEQYSMLGAGFKIAMRDLEIRGAGNILGAEQSGHIAAVGYEMYCHLLENAVHELKNEKPPEPASSTTVEIGVSGTIPKAYIPSDQRRLEAYRRLATASTLDQVKAVETDLTAAYGAPPKQVHRILHLAQLRVLAAGLGVKTITIREKDVVVLTKEPRRVAELLARSPKGIGKAIEATVRILDPKEPGQPAEVYFRPPEKYLEPETLVMVLKKRLNPALVELGQN